MGLGAPQAAGREAEAGGLGSLGCATDRAATVTGLQSARSRWAQRRL